MYNIWFDCCAVCMLAVLLLAVYAKGSVPVLQNRIFTLLTWLVLLTPVFHWGFYLDQNGVYRRGPLLPVRYVISLFYLGLAIYCIAWYRKFIPFARRAAFYSFAIIVLVSVVIQGLFPMVLVEGFGIAICLFMIYTTIQRPEELQDGQSGLLNKAAFLTML